MEPWTPVQLTVRTPMFLADHPAATAELRPPALRGAARFWFRALAAPVFDRGGRTDHVELARAEAELFGAASGGPRGGEPSPVAVRVLKPVPGVRDRSPDWLFAYEPKDVPGGHAPQANTRVLNGIGYLLGQGLYAPKSPKSGQPRPTLVRPSHLAPNSTGIFAVRVVPGRHDSAPPADYVREVVAICLWAASTFGGLGARTHRGFGGFTVTGLDALSDAVADTAPPAPPTPGHPAIRRLQAIVATRHRRPVPPPPAPAPLGSGGPPWPDAPTVGRWHVRIGTSTGTWPQLLNQAGRMLREVRAPVDRTAPPRSKTGLSAHKRWVTNEYEDAVVPSLRNQPPTVSTAPVAAFGLPLVFGKDATLNLCDGNDDLRRASPLWIRLHPEPNNRYRSLLHVFEAVIGPPGSHLELTSKRRSDPMILNEALAYQTIATYLRRLP